MKAKSAPPRNANAEGPVRWFVAIAAGTLIVGTAVALTMMTVDAAPPAAANRASRAAQTAQKQKGFQIADLAKLVRVSDPQISPDDKSVVVVVSRVNMKEDRSDNELVLIDLVSGAARTLTTRKGASSPRWSPSGDRLAFLAEATMGQGVSSPANSGDKDDSSGPQPQILSCR